MQVILLFVATAAGCLAPAEAPHASAPPEVGAVALAATDCRITLHVWLVPLAELAAKTPPEFPPTAYRGDAPADTPLGRLVFYLYDCADPAGAGWRSTLGVLGVRVDAPDEVLPPAGQAWATMYLLQAWAGGAPRAVFDAASMAFEEAVAAVEISYPVDGVATASMTLETGGASAFSAEMVSLPGQVETFARPERYYVLDGRDVDWIDVAFDTTLYESQGRVEYADGTPWADAVGLRAYDAAIDHHAMVGAYELTQGRGSLAGDGS